MDDKNLKNLSMFANGYADITETENGVDINANNIKVNCITSKNDSFSLDEEGNLIVNTITVKSGTTPSPSPSPEPTIDIKTLSEMLFPVGFICSFNNDFNPNNVYAGKWELLSDCFLVGAGSKYSLGEKGGNSSHTHTSAAHSHSSAGHSHNYGSLYSALNMAGTGGIHYLTKTNVSFTANEMKDDTGKGIGQSNYRNEGIQIFGDTGYTTPDNTGSTTPGNTGTSSNIPPYQAVNFWKRVE